MKKERKVVRHDYSKCPDSPKRDKEYYGIFKKKDGYVHIDTKRFKKTLKELGATEFWHDGMAANRSTPYLIPSRMKRHDYYVNIFRDSLEGLSREWREEFLPAIKTLRTPKEVEDGARLAALSTRSGEDTFDEANMIGTIAGWKRESSYWRAVEAIRFSFIERMACEVDRSVAYVLSKTGEIGDDYSSADLDIFLKKKIKKRYPLATIQENRAFNSLHKINNFLKHNTVSSYKKLAKYCSGFAVIDEKRPYETGMYAPNWIRLPKGYIEDTLAKLRLFFEDLCAKMFSEDPQKSRWDYNDYFLEVYREIYDPMVYLGICDEYGNCLVG